MDKFSDGIVPAERDARQKLLERISPDGEAFEELDEEFFPYPDDLARLAQEYAGD